MNDILQHGATPEDLEQAAAQNHRELFSLNALAQGGEVRSIDSLTWTYNGPGNGANIGFPSLTESNAGERLDEMMAYYREHPPRSVGYWSLHPPQPPDIGIRLLARGFQPGWRPCWMALDLDKINAGYSRPDGLVIKEDNYTVTGNLKNLPYAGDSGAISVALMHARPDLIKRFIATIDGMIVAHSAVLLTKGEYGVAGIYNVGVIPEMRNQGIGKAIVSAACLYARDKGYRYATLNATGRRMYEQVGFTWIGNGITWWLMNDRYLTNPPSARLVRLAEAVAIADIESLNDLVKYFTPADLNTALNNGMTLMQIAACYHQQGAGEWLIANGAVCSALEAWDMGWKDRAKELLFTKPEEVNRLYGEHQATLLHLAAERNDSALAQLVLSATPDLTIRDQTFDGTALGWAEHLKAQKIAEMIRGKM